MFIVFDLDGTLADTSHREHFVKRPVGQKDWDAFHAASVDDPPIRPIVEAYRCLEAAGHRVEIWTGRDDQYREATLEWLARHGIVAPTLRMRPTGDRTADADLKRGWMMERDSKPDLVFEDRARVVGMWRYEGVRCCQVSPGDF